MQSWVKVEVNLWFHTAKMYTAPEGEQQGKINGDTFLCDLDYIELAEQYKGQLDNNAEESAYESDGSIEATALPSTSESNDELDRVTLTSINNRVPSSKSSTSDGQPSPSSFRRSLRKQPKVKTTYQAGDVSALPQHKKRNEPANQDITRMISKTRAWYLDKEQREDVKTRETLVDKFVVDAMTHGNVGRFFKDIRAN